MKVGNNLQLEKAIEHLKSLGITIIQIGEKIGMNKQTIINIRRLKSLERQEQLHDEIKKAYSKYFEEETVFESTENKQIGKSERELLKEQIEFYKTENARLRAEIKQKDEKLDSAINKLLEK